MPARKRDKRSAPSNEGDHAIMHPLDRIVLVKSDSERTGEDTTNLPYGSHVDRDAVASTRHEGFARAHIRPFDPLLADKRTTRGVSTGRRRE